LFSAILFLFNSDSFKTLFDFSVNSFKSRAASRASGELS